jgi:hypothetical protein
LALETLEHRIKEEKNGLTVGMAKVQKRGMGKSFYYLFPHTKSIPIYARTKKPKSNLDSTAAVSGLA